MAMSSTLLSWRTCYILLHVRSLWVVLGNQGDACHDVSVLIPAFSGLLAFFKLVIDSWWRCSSISTSISMEERDQDQTNTWADDGPDVCTTRGAWVRRNTEACSLTITCRLQDWHCGNRIFQMNGQSDSAWVVIILWLFLVILVLIALNFIFLVQNCFLRAEGSYSMWIGDSEDSFVGTGSFFSPKLQTGYSASSGFC